MTDQTTQHLVPRSTWSASPRTIIAATPLTCARVAGITRSPARSSPPAMRLNIVPEEVIKFSGIGCSSKCPLYFLNRSFGFNSLHGRMPSLATGALFGDTTLKASASRGDGDTASIGMGQFKHIMRRNVNMVYIVENNGVYGLTKGQFSATADEGLEPQEAGHQPLHAGRYCLEALVGQCHLCGPLLRGRPQAGQGTDQGRPVTNGIAVLDIISPCVTFNNQDETCHSYAWGKDHEIALHDLSYVPERKRSCSITKTVKSRK